MVELIEHPLGVHIGQRHEDYLLDHGLGYSSVKELYLSPTEWWNDSPHNPLREPRDDDHKLAFKRGAALHTHILDGPRVYERVYGVRPTASSNPEMANTAADLLALCEKHGLPTVYGVKANLISRLVKAKVPEPILEVEQAKFDRTGKKDVAQKDDFRIRMLHRMMMRSDTELKLPEGDHLTLREALTKALTEVSVYWVDENGIRQRARFDILKPQFTGDLKSITQWKKSNFKSALLREVIVRGYMIQAAHYHEARQALRVAVDEGRVFGGNKGQRKLLERIARSDYWSWVFIFAKMDGAPQVKGIVVPPEGLQFGKAVQQRDEALTNFLYYREFHNGLSTPWFDPEVVWEPEEAEWPAFSVLGE